MIKSMTAYACHEAEISNLSIHCEIRSVNHRYADVNLKLPETLRFMESDLRALLNGHIKRGKVECLLSHKKPTKQGQSFVINQDMLHALLTATTQIEAQIQAPLSFSALDILAFPNILQEPSIDKNTMVEGVFTLVSQTLNQFILARNREGEQLKSLIEERCAKVHALVTQAKQRAPIAMQIMYDKIKNRIIDLVAQPNFDRLEQELVFLSQKLDVTEELDRLSTHTNEVLRILSEEEPAGKRLDFLMQELNREANTLTSKSTDMPISQIAIELKVLIEQMREQVQNIE